MKDRDSDTIKEAMKKIVLTGIGTIFLTEETVRNYLGELKLPKELWSGLLENASKTKQEFLTTFAKEAAAVLTGVNVEEEAKKFFEGHKIKVSVELSFDKTDSKSSSQKK